MGGSGLELYTPLLVGTTPRHGAAQQGEVHPDLGQRLPLLHRQVGVHQAGPKRQGEKSLFLICMRTHMP